MAVVVAMPEETDTKWKSCQQFGKIQRLCFSLASFGKGIDERERKRDRSLVQRRLTGQEGFGLDF